jgi:hypothetical protein
MTQLTELLGRIQAADPQARDALFAYSLRPPTANFTGCIGSRGSIRPIRPDRPVLRRPMGQVGQADHWRNRGASAERTLLPWRNRCSMRLRSSCVMHPTNIWA